MSALIQKDVFFSLQLMERYPLGHGAQMPQEAQRRLDITANTQFRTPDGFQQHAWYVTRIALIFLKSADGKKFRGLIQLDTLDDAIADGLKTLMTRDEDIPPGDAEAYAGFGKILTGVIYIVTFTWAAFLNDAEVYLQVLVWSLLFT